MGVSGEESEKERERERERDSAVVFGANVVWVEGRIEGCFCVCVCVSVCACMHMCVCKKDITDRITSVRKSYFFYL